MNTFAAESSVQLIYSILTAWGLVFSTTQAVAQTPEAAKSTHFFEIAYGSTPSGKLNSEPFTHGGMNGLTATIQYRATPLMEIEYGMRKAWGLPVDVSLSATQLRTPLDSYTTSLSPTPQSLNRQGITNIYSVNVYHDMLSRPNWNLFAGGGLGWADLVDADSTGLSASLSAGARYHFQSGFYGLLKLKVATVPKSKTTIGGIQLTLANQIMPMLSLGVGFDF
jgi:hypothetical protein